MSGTRRPGGAIRWRQRRGMRELDVLLERYARTRYEAADAGERAAFERLLEREDPELWAWLLGQREPPAEFADVVAALRRPP